MSGDDRCRGRLDPDLDDFSDRALPEVDRASVGLNRVNDPAVDPSDRLGLEPVVSAVEPDVDAGHQPPSGMPFVDGVRESEPGGVPRSSPRGARLDEPSWRPHRVLESWSVERLVDRFDRHPGLARQHARPDPLRKKPLRALHRRGRDTVRHQ